MNTWSRLKPWIPPVLLATRRRLLGRTLRFKDEPGGWAHATSRSTGYAAEVIVERVAAATREVLADRAVFERDSVLFHAPDYPYAIVAALLRSATLNRGRLEVVDFGGSLGSTYRQCRPLLTGLPSLRWHVVEQPPFVAAGQREFTTDELGFFSSPSELPPTDVPRLVLLSSVLQYLERPGAALGELLALAPSSIVIDRTPISSLREHRLTIQLVPKSVYDASYPCWVISRPLLLESLVRAGFRIMGEFPSMEGAYRTPAGLAFEFRGLIAERP